MARLKPNHFSNTNQYEDKGQKNLHFRIVFRLNEFRSSTVPSTYIQGAREMAAQLFS